MGNSSYYQRHREKVLKYAKNWRKENIKKGLCANGHTTLKTKTLCETCLNRINKKSEEYRTEWKKKVFDHYGRSCLCCGENHLSMLTLDHVNGLPGKRLAGVVFYRLLVKNNFPKDIQVLCHNCNQSKYALGSCEHFYRGGT